MNGKVKLRIGSKSSFWNRRYKVSLNGNFVGSIDYKNPNIYFEANIGDNKILLQTKTYQKELNLTVTEENMIIPIEITENWGAKKSQSTTAELMFGIQIGVLIAYTLFYVYMIVNKGKYFTPSLIIPASILISLLSSTRKTEPFELHFKKF
jgi:hypothetical protein